MRLKLEKIRGSFRRWKWQQRAGQAGAIRLNRDVKAEERLAFRDQQIGKPTWNEVKTAKM